MRICMQCGRYTAALAMPSPDLNYSEAAPVPVSDGLTPAGHNSYRIPSESYTMYTRNQQVRLPIFLNLGIKDAIKNGAFLSLFVRFLRDMSLIRVVIFYRIRMPCERRLETNIRGETKTYSWQVRPPEVMAVRRDRVGGGDTPG